MGNGTFRADGRRPGYCVPVCCGACLVCCLLSRVFAQLRTLDRPREAAKRRNGRRQHFLFLRSAAQKSRQLFATPFLWQTTRLPEKRSLTCGNNLSTAAPRRWWLRGTKKSTRSSRDLLAGQGQRNNVIASFRR